MPVPVSLLDKPLNLLRRPVPLYRTTENPLLPPAPFFENLLDQPPLYLLEPLGSNSRKKASPLLLLRPFLENLTCRPLRLQPSMTWRRRPLWTRTPSPPRSTSCCNGAAHHAHVSHPAPPMRPRARH